MIKDNPEDIFKWSNKFAWLPTRINSVRWVWLDCYQERFKINQELAKKYAEKVYLGGIEEAYLSGYGSRDDLYGRWQRKYDKRRSLWWWNKPKPGKRVANKKAPPKTLKDCEPIPPIPEEYRKTQRK